jgi:hypothetical protein
MDQEAEMMRVCFISIETSWGLHEKTFGRFALNSSKMHPSHIHSISRKPPPLCGVALRSSTGMAGAVGSAGREPWWRVKQTGSRRDKIPEKPPPLVVVRDFEVCHSHIYV